MMNYYLLKSTLKRQKVGDVFLKKDEIESITFLRTELSLYPDNVYLLCVYMKSGEMWHALFNTEDELRTIVNELTGFDSKDYLMGE